MSRPKSLNPNLEQITIRVTRSLMADLRDLAEADARPLANLIRLALTEFAKARPIEKRAA